MAKITYTIKKGDTLSAISKKYKTTISSILKLNKSKYPSMTSNWIIAGWKITIDSGASTSSSSSKCKHSSKSSTGKTTAKVTMKSKCAKGSKVKEIPKGKKVTVTKYCSTKKMYYVTYSSKKGWIPSSTIKIDAKKKTTKQSADYKTVLKTVTNVKKSGYNASVTTVLIDNPTGIHGIPYQFMSGVDNRMATKVVFGRKYVERIIAKMPLVLLSPGLPNFLPSYSSKERSSLLKTLAKSSKANKTMSDKISKLLDTDKNGRYYTFKFAYDEYYKYVNAMCRYCAICLGLKNVKHKVSYKQKGYNEKLGSFQWQKAVNTKMKAFINSQEYIAFYVDAETSFSESFSNSTTESQFASAINSASSYSKELQFLTGGVAGWDVKSLSTESSKDAFSSAIDGVTGIASKYLGGSKLFSNLNEGFKTIGKGGHLQFPEIWDDSDSGGRSYDFNLKLRTPDCDRLSWFLNICVPIIHIVALAAPRNMNANSYKAPFLVRGFYKGIWNCDMGIVTSCTINKGKEGAWTVDGLPTEVDVSVTIKDLYSMISISDTTGYGFFRNVGLVDYLSNMCGININKAETTRILESYILWTKNQIKDIYGNERLTMQNSLSSYASKAYNIISLKK